MDKVSVIIPAYNEGENIKEVLNPIPEEYEVIVVDDCSTDRTPHLARECGVKVIRNSERMGKGASLKRGVKESNGDFLVFIDGDSQFNSEEIRKFLSHKGYGLILGKRKKVPFPRNITNKLSCIAVLIATHELKSDVLTGFKAIKKGVWNEVKPKANDYRIDVELVLKTLKKKFNVKEVPVEVNYDSKSHLKPKDGVKIGLFLFKSIFKRLFGIFL